MKTALGTLRYEWAFRELPRQPCFVLNSGRMTDVFTTQKRTSIMSRVRTENTNAEIKVGAVLAKRRVQIARHDRSLPGSPDFTLPWFKVAVFVHGCFWHGHVCSRGRLPRTRHAFWSNKIKANQLRDERVRRKLRTLGWRTLVVWECRLRDEVSLRRRIDRLLCTRGINT